jgi:F-type H+-transporting ATPase subunit delta
MAEQITVARPYAEAVYSLAQQGGAFDKWSQMLVFAAAVAADGQMRDLIGNPKLTVPDQERAFLAVCDKALDDQAKNLVHLLVENRRLPLLPAISEAYEQLKAEHEGVLEAEIISAYPLSDAQKQEVVTHLESRFKRKTDATVTVDPELIGGVRIVVGDVVIDASVRGQLQNMAFTLKR